MTPAGKLKGEMQVYGEEKANYYKSKNNEVGNGATALHAAVENGHLAAVRVLLGHNAKQLPSMQGASPLLIALQYRHPRMVQNYCRDKRELPLGPVCIRFR